VWFASGFALTVAALPGERPVSTVAALPGERKHPVAREAARGRP
jgi:hypothetical protein